MATKLTESVEPTTSTAAAPAKPVAADSVKAPEPVAVTPPAPVARTPAKPVTTAAKPTGKPAKPVVEAAKTPVIAAKRAVKVAKAKVAPAAKAIVKAAKPAAAPQPVMPKPAAAPKPVIKKAAKAVVTAARTAAKPANAKPAKKEPITMATMFETPKLFTDMNDRTKTAVEKSQKFAAEMGDFSKGNIEAIVESGKIAAKGLETMGQDVADYTRKSFEGMTTTLKSLSSVKSPTDFFKLQSDYARSAFDAAVAQGSKNTEAMIKLTSDAAQPISSRFAVAVEKVKATA